MKMTNSRLDQLFGRFVGKTVDANGNECLSIILSTENNIFEEKATSNIYGNQSFIASIVGASLLLDGDKGLENKYVTSMQNKDYFNTRIQKVKRAKIAFPSTPTFNEVTISFDSDIENIINTISDKGSTLVLM